MSQTEASPGLFEDLTRTPVTTGTVLSAVVVTIAKGQGRSIDPFLMDEPLFFLQPWRVVASTLPHANVLHLIFNVWWVWLLGRALEFRLGSGRTLGLFLLLAIGSMSAEFAFSVGGIGLSGVVYGLAGYLWARGRRDPTYRLLDSRTIELLVVWFFLCIVLTYTGAMQVANVAHGAGAALGVLLGFGWRAGASLFVVVAILLAGVFRPYVNLSSWPTYRAFASRAAEAFQAGHWERGLRFTETAIRRGDQDPRTWHNYGVGLRRVGRMEEADAAFEHSRALGGVPASRGE